MAAHVGGTGASAQREPLYRTERVRLEFGAAQLTLNLPTRLEDHFDATALLRDPDAPEPPYWLHLWAGSRALAHEVARREWSGRCVAEVGCGLGLAGLVAARFGARVVLIDHVLDALRLARENARDNGLAVDLLQTDALQPGLRGEFDAVLIADVTYEARLQQALANFVAERLAAGGVALVTDSVRNHDPAFRLACEQRGLRVGERELRELDEGRAHAVRLTEVCW